jgi:hypothetical protein
MQPPTRVGDVPQRVLEETRAFVAKQRTLEDVVRGVLLAGGALCDVVVQDEYTHDVVVRPTATSKHFLVYDTT